VPVAVDVHTAGSVPNATLEQLRHLCHTQRRLRGIASGASILREVRVWDVALAEIARQAHVVCAERGLLLERGRVRINLALAFMERIIGVQFQVGLGAGCGAQ